MEIKLIDIKKKTIFETLFRADPALISRITEDMKNNGYDSSFPVLLGKVENEEFLIDGHMRYASALSAGILSIPYQIKEFDTEQQALEYAIHIQRDRRNITDAELFDQISRIDRLFKKGCKANNPVPGKSAALTARMLGTSTRNVERVRTIRKKGTPAQHAAIIFEKKSINRIYNEIQNPKKAYRSTDMDYVNQIAVDIMLITADLFPELNDITDGKSARWENALTKLLTAKIKNN